MSAAAGAPVRAGDRVSDVVARDESLVEVFVALAPQFARLRSRAMRRVMARLVTVEQAARMAGLEPAEVLRRLNSALGFGSESDAAAESGDHVPAPLAEHPADAPVIEVDVRAELRAGREPFSRIMAGAARLGAGEVLHLRTTFEPVPLYSVLGKRGLAHEARAEGPDDWSVWFWQAPGTPPPVPAAAVPAGIQPDPGTIHLDVRGLEPPEPMVRTLAALETLPSGGTLLQVNTRVPQFLLPVLAERGFTWEVDESPADYVVVRIRRRP